MGATIPMLEEDSDSDVSANLMSFSAVFESQQQQQPELRKSNSPVLSLSPRSEMAMGASNALSTESAAEGSPPPVIEDALRARAEQAESAAERLLELVEPEEEEAHHSSIPTALLVGSGGTPPQQKPKPAALPIATPPATPVNRAAAIMRQAAMFKDSPAYNGSTPSLLAVLRDRKHETGWWLKRMKSKVLFSQISFDSEYLYTVIDRRASLQVVDGMSREQELSGYISRMDEGRTDIEMLQRLSLFCDENPAMDAGSPPVSPFGHPASPSPFTEGLGSPSLLQTELWTKDKNFERLFNGLIKFLDPAKVCRVFFYF
jgi:CLIP-associating protein 1/2